MIKTNLYTMPKTHVYDSFEKNIYRHSYFISPNVHLFVCFFQGGVLLLLIFIFWEEGCIFFYCHLWVKIKRFLHSDCVCMTSMTS